MQLPDNFLRSLTDLNDCRVDSLVAALKTDRPISIRFNPYKVDQPQIADPVSWCRYGCYLPSRPSFIQDPAFHAGVYYVQEAGSMFLQYIVESLHDDCGGLKILDLCAAPGGKTTLLSTLVGAEGMVVANEVIRQRVSPLMDNVKRWGLGNVIIAHNDPSRFAAVAAELFDVVVVDAPCSGEGMFRKNPQACLEWSEANVELCAARQKRILSDAWESLAVGGVLIYSTCTFNRKENEDNVQWLLDNFDCESVELKANPEWGIVCGGVQSGDVVASTFRFYPDQTRSEGFFTAVIRKAGQPKRLRQSKNKTTLTDADRKSSVELSRWVNQPEFMKFAGVGDNFYGYYENTLPFVKRMAADLTIVYSGVYMGQIFGNKLRPDHPLALFHDVRTDVVDKVELTEADMLRYLHKQDMDHQLFVEGFNLVCAQGGMPVGWIKRIGLRCNNLYPKELRILME